MKAKICSSVVFVIAVFFSVVTVFGDEEVRFTTHIKPLFDRYCINCHGADSPEYPAFKQNKKEYLTIMKGPRMDTYAHMIYFVGWPDTGALMRHLDDGMNSKDGKPADMYKYLGSTEAERKRNLQIFKEWVGNWTLKRWKDLTKEEINGFKVRY